MGVRTGITGDRRIAKSFKCDSNDCFFIDLDGYYVSYGSDEGGDAWQRRALKKFDVSVNGKVVGSYNQGETVTVSGASTIAGKAFYRWSESSSEGLYPFADYVANVRNPSLTFKMPQNRVSLVTDLVDVVSKAAVSVERPVGGEELPDTATLDCGSGHTMDVSVVWLDAKGKVATRAAYGARYRLYFFVRERDFLGTLAFDGDMSVGDVTLACSDGSAGPGVQEAHVDSYGQLNVTSEFFQTDKLGVTDVEPGAATAATGATERDLLEALPPSARVTLSDGTEAALATDASSVSWPDGMLSDGAAVAGTYEPSLPLVSTDSIDATDRRVLVTFTVSGDEPTPEPDPTPDPGPDPDPTPENPTTPDADSGSSGSVRPCASALPDTGDPTGFVAPSFLGVVAAGLIACSREPRRR